MRTAARQKPSGMNTSTGMNMSVIRIVKKTVGKTKKIFKTRTIMTISRIEERIADENKDKTKDGR